MNRHHSHFSRYCLTSLLAATALAASTIAQAVPVNTGALSFQTSGQNMWGQGSAVMFNEVLDLGTSWSTGTTTIGGVAGGVSTIPGIPIVHNHSYSEKHTVHCHSVVCLGADPHPKVPEPHIRVETHATTITVDTRTGGTASASTSGNVGLLLGAQLDSGSVNATVSYSTAIETPDEIFTNTFFSLTPTQQLVGPQSLTTNLSEASAYVDAYLGTQANLSATGCFFGLGCSSGNTSVGFGTQTAELISFNRDSSGEISILDVAAPAAFQFGDPVDVGPYGSATFYVPDLNANGGLSGGILQASGASDFIDVNVDLDNILTSALGLPGLLGTSVSAGPLNVGYDIIDVSAGLDFDIEQAFTLDPSLIAQLDFDHPVFMDGYIDPVTSWIGAWGEIPDVALHDQQAVNVTPTFYLDALFNNDTTIGVDGTFDVAALAASFSVEAFGLSVDIGELGPLYEYAASIDLFTFPTLYSNEFALGGFSQIAGNTFTLRTTAVPEPGSLLLLALGLIALSLHRRRTLTCQQPSKPHTCTWLYA
jgi:PEP-CTERM motif